MKEQEQSSNDENNNFENKLHKDEINKLLNQLDDQYVLLQSILSQVTDLLINPYRQQSLDSRLQNSKKEGEENQFVKEQFKKINDRLNKLQQYQDTFFPPSFQLNQVANSYVIIKSDDLETNDFKCGGNVVNIENRLYVSTFRNCCLKKTKAPSIETINEQLKEIFVEDYYLDQLHLDYQKQFRSTNVNLALMPIKQNQYEEIIKNKIPVEVSSQPAQHLQKLRGLQLQEDYIKAITAKVCGIKDQNKYVQIETDSSEGIIGAGLFFGNKLQTVLRGFYYRDTDQYKCQCKIKGDNKSFRAKSVSAHYLYGIAKNYNCEISKNEKTSWNYYSDYKISYDLYNRYINS